jgi:RNA methyltransferase, TrmH family
MLTKNLVKHLQSLRDRKSRELHSEFIAEGVKLVDEMLNSHYTVHKVFGTSEWIESHEDFITGRENLIHEVTEDELKKISSLVTPNEVLAVVGILEDILPEIENAGKLVLMLDRIQDPGNLGTIIRTADWFGIRHIFCSEDTADLYNPKVVQATMGSICRVNVHYTALGDLIKAMKGSRAIYGAFSDGENIYQIELKSPAVVLIGNESKGISRGLIPMITDKIGIPAVSKGAESLNASVAAGIICSEFTRPKT